MSKFERESIEAWRAAQEVANMLRMYYKRSDGDERPDLAKMFGLMAQCHRSDVEGEFMGYSEYDMINIIMAIAEHFTEELGE